jgi:hypothetical protein
VAQLSSVRASSTYGEDETRERGGKGAPVMVGHYELEARRNSGKAAGKETAAMLSPRLNRRCEKVDEVAQLTAKQCARAGEQWCGVAAKCTATARSPLWRCARAREGTGAANEDSNASWQP